MKDASFFKHPTLDWQRRYEALRASLVDRQPDKVVADRFGYAPGYVRLLRFRFRHGQLDFSEPVPEGKARRRGVTAETRRKICEWRKKGRLSAGEITELLSEDGIEISVRTVERVLAEEGFPKLPRRTRLKIGRTVKGADIPERSEKVTLKVLRGQVFDSPGAGVFLFAPFLAQLDLSKIVRSAKLPSTQAIPARNYLLSFLALKLLGTERYAHAGDHGFDPGLGVFAGLNVLPKSTAMSTYAYSLDEEHIQRLQRAFVRQANKVGLYDGSVINLDFHTTPHYGEESELEKHWAGARGKTMKGALTLFAQDAETKLLLYSATDILREEANDEILSFLSFWRRVRRGVKPTFVFDSRLTTYARLAELAAQEVKFITLRRRGKGMIAGLKKLKGWKRIHIPHVKRKYPNPQIHESMVKLRDYDGEVRQIVVRGNGREKPAFMITNDLKKPGELVVGDYARRWRVENGIAEAVSFFNLNALPSPILVKVHFDVAMTLVADTLYSMLAQKLRGFEHCDAPKLFRHFVRGKGRVAIEGSTVTVTYPKRAHNPILRGVPWNRLPGRLPGFRGGQIVLRFE